MRMARATPARSIGVSAAEAYVRWTWERSVSAWRRKAIALFPERKDEIERTLNLTLLLNALGGDLDAVFHGHRDEPTLEQRAFNFARWCLAHPGAARIVDVAFFEHLPATSSGRDAVVRHVPPEEYRRLLPLWQQVLEPDAVAALERAYSRRLEIRLSQRAT